MSTPIISQPTSTQRISDDEMHLDLVSPVDQQPPAALSILLASDGKMQRMPQADFVQFFASLPAAVQRQAILYALTTLQAVGGAK